jgi:hypothetical protein
LEVGFARAILVISQDMSLAEMRNIITVTQRLLGQVDE